MNESYWADLVKKHEKILDQLEDPNIGFLRKTILETYSAHLRSKIELLQRLNEEIKPDDKSN